MQLERILAAMDPIDPFPPADPLGEALHLLRMNGAFYCRSELSAPWGLTLPPMPGYVWFHVVTSGRLWLESRRRRPPLLRPGDLALVPTARGTCSAASPARRRPRSSTSSASRSATATRSCATAAAARHDADLRRGALRPPGRAQPRPSPAGDHPHRVVRLPTADWMQGTLRLMAAEARELRPGGEAVITRLGDILVIQAIRSWIETDPGGAHGLARRAAGPPDRPRDRAHPPRPGPRVDASRRSPTRWRCRARRSRPASPSSSASRR